MRLFDELLDFLMRPRVRRIRRWSSIVTLPVFLVLLYTGNAATGVAVVAIRVALYAAVVLAAWRVRGERGEALRDLLMHPRLRAFLRAEADVLLTLPRLLLRRRRAPDAFHYARGGDRLALAAAFTPAVLAEAVPFHLLLPADWLIAHIVAAGLHLYALLWLWAWALGPRAWPHAVVGDALVVRAGPLHRVRVPLDHVRSVAPEPRRHRGERHVRAEDGVALLPVGNRTDVVLELSAPARFEQPLSEPVEVTSIALASNAPDEFARELERAALRSRERDGLAAVALPLAAYELAR